jgi:phage baseplate assembly protein W
MSFASSTLVVTYEYSAPATTTVMCEAMIPLTMSSDDSPGITAGESFSNNVAGDAQALIAALSVQESSPVLVQSAAYLTCVAYGTTAAVNLRAGSQSFRAYSPGTGGSAAQGDTPLVHRVDHGGGWTLARGDNRLVLNTYNATTAGSDLFGYALINYKATAPSDVDAATHVVNYAVCSYGTTFPAAVDIAASSPLLRVPVLGTPYRLQGVLIEQYHRASNSNLFAQMLVEQRAGEWDAAGFITTGYRHGGFAQFGSWRSQWALTRAFNLDHLHTGKLNIETARRQVAWTSVTTEQSSWSWWLTYHQLVFGVAGTVTIGTIPVPPGKTVQIFARDASSTELVTTTTTGTGGIFNVSVVDSTRTYFASYQDGATLGRSADAPPGAAFNIAIPSSAAMPIVPAATDVHGQLASGSVQLSWSHPGDIAAQGVAFDIYQSSDPTDRFRSAAATSVPALTVSLSAAPLLGERYFSVVARRGNAQALPSKAVRVSIPPPAAAPPTPAPAARDALSTGVGFPFGITPTGSVFAQGGDDLLRGKILQLLLTSPGERVNRPDYGTRLLDLVFDPNSDVLAATMEFTITRALQQEFADDIQVDSVQLTPSDDTLLVDISYLRKADLRLEQVRVGVPLPAGGSP